MGAVHRCHVEDCASVATDRCFECGAWCCDMHRSAVQIPTSSAPFRAELCAACLLSHLEAPDRFGVIAIELPAPEINGQGVGLAGV